jgi:hypothetical protein
MTSPPIYATAITDQATTKEAITSQIQPYQAFQRQRHLEWLAAKAAKV